MTKISTVRGECYMKYRKLNKQWKYETDQDESFECHILGFDIAHEYFTLDQYGNLLIKKGYRWDGTTVAIDTDSNMTPSLFHDCGYQMIRLGLLPLQWKHVIDWKFKLMCIERGMSNIRANYFYYAVKWFGGKCCVPMSEKPPVIYEAP